MRWWICLGLGVLWASAVTAEDAPRFGPAAAWVKPAVLPKLKPLDATDTAAAKVLLVDEQRHFQASETAIYVETVLRAQTAQGLAALGTVSVAWKPGTGTVTVHKLNILRGDKVIDVLANGHFTVLRRETNLEAAALDGILTATLQIEDFEVGDVLDTAFTITRYDPVLKGRSEDYIGGPLLEGPVSRLRLRTVWETPTAMHWRVGGDLPTPKLLRNGTSNELLLDVNDVMPQIQPKDAPRRFTRGRELQFSDYGSWAQVSAIFAPLYAKAEILGPQSLLTAQIARIRAASSDPTDQASAALALVEERVRYVFLGMNDGALAPTSADETWSRRFGDCKAKTVLLLALLHGLGIEAEPALVSTGQGDGLDERLPTASVFDHILVRAIIGGKTFWLDATRTGDTHVAWLRTPPYHYALPLRETGASLIPLAVPPLAEPESHLDLTIDASAGLDVPAPVHVELTLRGDAATQSNLTLTSAPPADVEKGVRKFWTERYSFIDVRTVATRFDKTTGNEVWTMDGVANMGWYASGSQARRYEADDARLGWKSDPRREPGPHPDAPISVNFPAFDTVHERIKLPRGGEGFTVEAEPIDATLGGFALHRSAKIVNGVFELQSSSRSLVPEITFAQATSDSKLLSAMAGKAVYVLAPIDYAATSQDNDHAIGTTPGTAAEFVTRGNAYIRENDYDNAAADFDQARAKDPKLSDAWSGSALAHFYKDEFDAAKADAERSTALDSHDQAGLNCKGLLAAHEGNYQEAVEIYTRAVDSHPDDSFAYERRGWAYWALGQSDKAQGDWAEVLRLDPSSTDTHLTRADAFRFLGQVDNAKAELDAAIKARPFDAATHLARGRTLAAMGDIAGAMQEFARVIASTPTVRAYLTRAYYRDQGDVAGRQSDIAAAMKRDPKATDPIIWDSELALEARDYARAVKGLSDAIALDSKDQDLRLTRARAYAHAGQNSQATTDLAVVRASAKPNARQLNSLCWTEAPFDAFVDAALVDCDAALKLQPLSAQTLDSRAFVSFRLGHLDDALTLYGKALALEPHHASSFYGRGLTYLKKGQTAQGRADIAMAKRIAPYVGRAFDLMGLRP